MFDPKISDEGKGFKGQFCMVEMNLAFHDSLTYELLQVLRISLFDKTPAKELFTNTEYKDVKELNFNQIFINIF